MRGCLSAIVAAVFLTILAAILGFGWALGERLAPLL